MPFVKKFNRNASRRFLAVVALFVVFLMVVSSIFVYYTYFLEEEKFEEKIEENMVIDNHISPLENQALILELKRIRHRGFYDLLLTKSCAWRNIPSFYFVVELDGLEYKSKDVEHLGTVVEILYDTWDSMFQENKIVRDAEEEQETSAVKVTIVERVKTGLLKRKTTDIERDSFTVEYDYRTGRWHGDDYFMDEDGYGYYLGDTFEVWFNIYQNDYDCDYIPYWVEANILGTDPRRSDVGKDPDGDGIDTFWEWKWGYDPFVWDDHERLDPESDGIENIEEFQIAKWLSDPYQKNMYCEIDYMGRGSLFDPPHIIDWPVQQALIEVYSRHNIKTFFDMGWPDTPRNGGGDVLPHYNFFSQDSGMILQYYEHHFPEERRGIFRYIVGVHGGPFNHPSKGNVYDSIAVGFEIMPRKRIRHWIIAKIPPWERNQHLMIAQTLLHELGHSIGIHPWTFEGCDNSSYPDVKKTYNKYYFSVMNYGNMYNVNLLDYSDGKNGPPYDQNDWENIWVADFQYPNPQIEEIYFKPPSFEKIVWGETEYGVTGYTYDEELTEQWKKEVKDYSPLDPIPANWIVFKINKDYKEKNPQMKDVKILVQPDLEMIGWAEYAEGQLDSDGKIKIYSQQEIIDAVIEKIAAQ